jgi:hypothetical protein
MLAQGGPIGGPSGSIHADQMFPVMAGGRLDCINVAKDTQRESWKTTLGSQGTYQKQAK